MDIGVSLYFNSSNHARSFVYRPTLNATFLVTPRISFPSYLCTALYTLEQCEWSHAVLSVSTV